MKISGGGLSVLREAGWGTYIGDGFFE